MEEKRSVNTSPHGKMCTFQSFVKDTQINPPPLPEECIKRQEQMSKIIFTVSPLAVGLELSQFPLASTLRLGGH